MTYKNIRIKKKGGGYRTQRVKVLKSGKYRFVKNIGSQVKKLTKKSKKNNPKRRTRKLARRKKRRGKRSFTIPLAPIAGLIASPALRSAVTDAVGGNWDGAMANLGQMVGYWDGKFYPEKVAANIGPMVLGLLVHKFVGGPPLNLNRTLANAGVPVVRI